MNQETKGQTFRIVHHQHEVLHVDWMKANFIYGPGHELQGLRLKCYVLDDQQGAHECAQVHLPPQLVKDLQTMIGRALEQSAVPEGSTTNLPVPS